MEKIKLMINNKYFMTFISVFIFLIGLLIIFKSKKPEIINESDDLQNDQLNNLKNENKKLKLVITKNKELEKKAHGKSITGKNKSRIEDKPIPKSDDEEGTRTSEIVPDDESITPNEPDDSQSIQ